MGAEYLTGAIDLIFRLDGKWYIADYKSNRCRKEASSPARLEHFGQENLLEEVLSHHYPLQYSLYTLALHRYLSFRLGSAYEYSRDFGGVCYLFLRGMTYKDGPPGHGVFHDRLPDEALNLLDSCCPRMERP